MHDAKKFLSPEEQEASLTACVDAWNAEQRRIYGPPTPAPKTTPERRERQRRYREANKDRIAQRRKDAEYRKSTEYWDAIAAIPLPPGTRVDPAAESLREWNAKERARVAAEDAARGRTFKTTPAQREKSRRYRARNKERARVAAEEAAAGRSFKTTPAQREKAARYYAANKERITAKARQQRAMAYLLT